MKSDARGMYPIPLWQFVLTLRDQKAESWKEVTMEWIVKQLNSRNDHVLYHLSSSTSSLSDYVRHHKIDLKGKTAHCDVQYAIWKLNMDAGNEKSPIDSLWMENKYRFFRNGGGSTKQIHKASFQKAIVYAAELSKRPYRRTGRGVICPAKDGHFCLSMDEVRIDDWFSENKISHTKEPLYPRHPELNPRALKRADWKVGDWLIEYAGLANDKKYDIRLEEKLKLAKLLKVDVLVLTKSDLVKLDSKLGRFFSRKR